MAWKYSHLAFLLFILACGKSIELHGFEKIMLIDLIAPGAHTPKTNMLSKKYVAEYGPDQLTPNGERMHFTLGQHIGRLYSELLTNQTVRKEIEVYSSSVPMCQSSALSHAVGIFPKDESNKVETGFTHLKDPAYRGINVTRLEGDYALPNGQKPFFLEMESPSEDFLFLPNVVLGCPKLSASIQNSRIAFHSDLKSYMARFDPYIAQARTQIHEQVGHFEWTPDKISSLFEEIQASYHHDGVLSLGLNSTNYEKLALLHGMVTISTFLENTNLRRMHTHHIAKKIVSELNNKAKNLPYAKKYILFSGEDRNLISLLHVFKAINYKCLADRLNGKLDSKSCVDPPKMASSLLFELLKKDNAFFVRVLYDGVEIEACPTSAIPTNRIVCPLTEFSNFLKANATVKDFFSLCENDEASMTQQDGLEKQVKNQAVQIGALIGIALLQFCALCCIYCCRVKRTRRIVLEVAREYETQKLKEQMRA